MAAGLECMNVPVENKNDIFMDKFFVNKPVAIGYNIGKGPDFDNLFLVKDAQNK